MQHLVGQVLYTPISCTTVGKYPENEEIIGKKDSTTFFENLNFCRIKADL